MRLRTTPSFMLTMSAKKDGMPSLLRKQLAISGVGVLDATAIVTPFCFSAFKIPIASG